MRTKLVVLALALALTGASSAFEAKEGNPVRKLGKAIGALFSAFDPTTADEKALGLDDSYRALAESPATASLRLVRANAGVLNEKAVWLALDLEPGLELRAHRVDSYFAPTGSLVWSGILEDPASAGAASSPLQLDPLDSVMIVRNGDKITGNVHFKGGAERR